MSVLLQLGSSPIHLKDDEFSNGFQVGYLHFKKDIQDKQPISDELLSAIIAQTFIDVHHTSRCSTGYLIGLIAALLEQPAATTPSFAYVVGELPEQPGVA